MANNRRRRTFSALYAFKQFLDYQHRTPRPSRAIRASMRFQRSNQGPIVFRGSYSIPPYPAPQSRREPAAGGASRAGSQSAAMRLSPDREPYLGPRTDGRPVAERLAAHGTRVRRQGRDRWLVPMAQNQRGLIPPLLDAQAAEEMVAADRLYC